MIRFTFTILDEHLQRLRQSLLRDHCEYGSLLLCGRSQHVDPWTGEMEERALVREVVEVDSDAFQTRTPTGLLWSTTPLFHLAKRAREHDNAICVAHSHPLGDLYFSEADDAADRESAEIVVGRTESRRPHFFLVMDGNGEILVRAVDADLAIHKVDLTRIVGDRLHLRYDGRGGAITPEEFDRQARAFGVHSVEDLAHLRIGIVGSGGTGSAVACLLARLGVSKLLLIDDQCVEASNLNRLHFSTRQDAITGRKKVDVVGQAIAEIGLVDSVVRIPRLVDSSDCRDALRSCDVIFGCTDDHAGRNFLNYLAHFYLIPVIDMGLLIETSENGGYDTFDGRVTVVQPGYPCQICRRLVDPQRMLEEDLRRRDPHLFEERRLAGYVANHPGPSPAVVTFTTEIAAVAVNELLHRLTGFRGTTGHCAERVRVFTHIKDSDSVPGGASRPGCPLCDRRKYDARGDMTPFLNLT